MEQNEIRQNTGAVEDSAGKDEKDSNSEPASGDLSALADAEKADNIPVESIGSYGRIDELLNGEGTEKHGRADSGN